MLPLDVLSKTTIYVNVKHIVGGIALNVNT